MQDFREMQRRGREQHPDLNERGAAVWAVLRNAGMSDAVAYRQALAQQNRSAS